jgi:WhiB family redox-sensing transcriptional regulator
VTDWRQSAACKGESLDVFFTDTTFEAAKLVCATCPVVDACLDDALSVKMADDHGVRGGYTPIERRRLRNHRRQDVIRLTRAEVAAR